MTEEAYKVVVCRQGRFVSCCSPREVQYKPGRWTRSPRRCGPLAVFTTVEQAADFALFIRRWLNDRGFTEQQVCVFRCLWTPWKRPLRREGGQELACWCPSAGIAQADVPKGTRLAQAVKLEKEMGRLT